MKRNLSVFLEGFFSVLLILSSVFGWGQTNPTPFDLSTGNFSFISQTATNTNYPANMQGWTTGTANITNATTACTADGALVNSYLSHLGVNGFNFLVTSSSPNTQVGEIAVALNTTNRTNILVSWLAADNLATASRTSALTLQYRIGTNGIFTTVAGTTYTSSATSQAASQNFSNIALPASCENQPIVQIRWIYNEVSGAGGRDPIRLDDITVTSIAMANPVDGTISAGEYGTHTDGSNQMSNSGIITYLKSDATNLYVGVSGANLAEAFVLYLDKNPIIPINGGGNSDGTLVGFNYDNTNFAQLPFRADAVIYVKNNYREFRTSDASNGWSAATSGFGSYAENTTGNVREFSIPWSIIGGAPTAFNFFSYVASASGFVYGETPIENPQGNIGTSARNERYFTVTNNTVPPFSRNCFVFNNAGDENNIGNMDVYDFTMNSNLWMSRSGGAIGAWNIAGTFLQTQGNIYLGGGANSMNVTGATNLQGGSLDFGDITAISTLNSDLTISSGASLKLSNQYGGDLKLLGNWNNAGNFNPNSRSVTFNASSGTQIITNTLGETFAYLIHNGTGLLQFANNVTVNASTGDVFQLLAGTIDLNGKSLTLSGTGGNVKISGAQILNSSVAGALFNITGANAVKTISGGTLSIPANVTTVLNNGIDFGASVTTIAGTVRVASGGYVHTNPPKYAANSTLEYNGVTGFNVTSEWTGGGITPVVEGSGIPSNVTLVNSTVNMPNTNRGLAKKLTIGTTSILNMNATSGDLYISGDWSDAGTFNHNNRAVFFNGNGATQLISNSNATNTETYAYLINLKPTGTKIMLNTANVNIVGTGAGALTLRGAGDFDITNLNLSIKNSGSIIVDGGIRNITSSFSAAGNFIIDGATSVISQNSGTLVINSKVPTILNNSINFGLNGTVYTTTINGKLIVKPNGTATESPVYGSSASLEYNATGSTAIPHQANKEWSGNIAGSTTYNFTAGAGIPPTVNLINSTVQQFASEVSVSAMSIDAASNFIQSPVANYNDLKIFGNLTNNGIITGNNRTLIFQGSAPQTISGVATSVSNIKINNSYTSNVAVTTSIPLTIASTLDLVKGRFAIGANNVSANITTTPDNYANSFVVTNSTGQLKLPVSTTNVIFPIGINSATGYSPITVSNSGTSDIYGFNVKTDVADVVADIEYMVKKSWYVTEAFAGGGNLKVSPQWVAADEGTSFPGTDHFIQLYTTPSLVSEYPATVTGTSAVLTNSGDNFSNSLPASATATYFAVGRHRAREIDVTGNSVSIASGDTTPSTADNTDYGNAVVGTPLVRTFTIKNLGQMPLTVNSLSISPSSDFTIENAPTTYPFTIAGGGSVTFDVKFNPTTEGIKTATVTIGNDDADEGTYTFVVTGISNLCTISNEVVYKLQDFEGSNPLTNTSKWQATLSSTNNISVGTGSYYGSSTTATESGSIESAAVIMTNFAAGRSITTNAINASSYSDIVFSMKLAAFSTTNTNGLDDSDIITVSVKAGTSATYKTIMTITGKGGTSQNIWGFDATGIAQASYNVSTPVSFVASGNTTNTGSQITPDGFSTVKISDIPNVDGLQIRVVLQNNAPSEVWSIDNLKLYSEAKPSIKTWNGTTWVGGTPTIGDKAVIDGDYSTASNGSFTACQCQVNSGKTLTISPSTSLVDNSLTIKYNLNNLGNVNVESDASLIQLANNTVANSGAITVKRDAHGMRYLEYTYWASPVSGQTFKSFSPTTPDARFYQYNESNDLFESIQNPLTNIFGNNRTGVFESAAKGYAIRYYGTSNLFTGTFKGVPNNGDITFPLKFKSGATGQGYGYNMVGNPYPSNIDFYKLHAANSTLIYNTAYFWTNINPNGAMQGSNYPNGGLINNYAILNGTGGVPATGAAGSSATPNEFIKVGQGFIVKAKAPGNLQFTNGDGSTGIRTANNTGYFFNNRGATVDRFWLELKTPLDVVTTQLIGYLPAATYGFERDYDSPLLTLGADAFYSSLETYKLAIQGRGIFTATDIVPLGTSHYAAGNYTITLKEREGIFAGGQNIYLKDKQTGTVTNLTEGSYTFAANKGENTGRFEIIYEPQVVLATDSAQKDDLVVYKNQGDFVVRSQKKDINQLEVYDAGGRLIYAAKPNKRETVINAEYLVEGVYVLKITRNGEVSMKKIVK